MDKKFYLLRHGQTVFNSEKRLQGHCNSPLTPLGRQQAKIIGESLRKTFNNSRTWPVYSSPLERALETAKIVCEELEISPDSIIQDSRLIEVELGDWEQQKIPELQQLHPGLCDRPDWYLHAPGAEAYDNILKRLKSWLNDRNVPNEVIVVSHGLTGAVLRGIYAQMDYQEIWSQDLPQDAYYFLTNNIITRVNCKVSGSVLSRLSHP